MTIRRCAVKRMLRMLAAVLLWPALALAGTRYSITSLPDNFTGFDMNNAGQIVGRTLTSGAVVWSDTGIVDLGALRLGIDAFAINNRGEVAGRFDYGSGGDAFIYSNGTFRDVGRPAQFNYATPLSISDNGNLTGETGNFPGDTSRAFLYANGTWTTIGTFGGDQGIGYAVNDSGTVVGDTALPQPPDSPRGQLAPFVYAHGAFQDIDQPGITVGTVQDVNNAGMIVGSAFFSDTGLGQAFVYADGRFTDLGGSPGMGMAINDTGGIVGRLFPTSPTSDLTHGFVFTAGHLRDLNELVALEPGWTVTDATDINDAGQILATVCPGSTLGCRTVRLDLVPAVPEPGSVAMLLGGLATLAWPRRRRSR